MVHLKLVAGTAVSPSPEAATAKSATERTYLGEVLDAELEAKAREIIYGLKPGLDDMSVSELLAELNRPLPGNDFIPEIQRRGVVRTALLRVGIHAHSALPEMELDVDVFGLVVNIRRLMKGSPELKPLKNVLDGLTL
ncbi:hypothetical protein [Burkholderia sp. RS02]|uniref:hypothetical protein n=1 Tax=unclassified Burkholderia TaxID=2613784 RepID=UPI003218DDC4